MYKSLLCLIIALMFSFLSSFIQLSLPSVVGTRLWHTVASVSLGEKVKQLLFFGGCPGLPLDLSTAESWSKLAATALIELGMGIDAVYLLSL